MQLETKRQMFHASGAVTPLFVHYLGVDATLQLLFILLFLTVITSISYKRQVRLPLVYWLVERLERPAVKNNFPARGAIYYIIGMILSLILFPTPIALACILSISLGDAASTIIGKNYGVHRWPYNPHKSIEGSAACFFLSFLGASTQVQPVLAVITGITAALAESLPLPVDDNLSIPLTVGLILSLAA